MRSQTDRILSHLKRGRSLTAIQALDDYQVFRLAARIKDLRDSGHNIHTSMYELPSGKRVARYTLGGG